MRSLLGVVATLVWLDPHVAHAQTVDEGKELFYAAEFDRAAEVLEAVLGASTLDVASAVEAHRFLAAARSLQDRAALARQHAEAAVLLDPTVSAPEGASRLAEIFDEARRGTGGERARVRISVDDASSAAARVVRAEVAPYAVLLFARTRIVCAYPDGTTREEELAGPSAEVELPASWSAGDTTCTGTAFTTAGAQLLATRRSLSAAMAGERGGSMPWPWIAVGAGAALAAIVAVIVAVVVASGSNEANVRPIEPWW